ncbi:hypothetical protein MATL_G00130820 [Megalops atlanticus]|uniref:Alpha-1,3-mannosyl-glycoprotein 2-beta-N-acetylglucosaminyltransferase n=1 Tax=Megalops atlanticus TaxID=7932 RepID=A0A9D3PVK0_MEGAT|nr:hypothetical protein MATL_G00130820 [Megalops atlanticus]
MIRKKGSFILCGAFLFVAWNAVLLLFLLGRPPPKKEEDWRVAGGRGGGDLAQEVIRLAEEVESQLETQKKLLKQIWSHWSQWESQKENGKRVIDSGKEGKQAQEFRNPQQLPQPPQKYLSLDQNKGKRVQDFMIAPIPNSNLGSNNKEQAVNRDKLASSITTTEDIIPILVIACDRVTVKRCLDKLIQYRPSADLYPIIVSQDCGHAETARVIESFGSQVTHIRQPDLSDIQMRPEHKKFQGYYKISRHYRWALSQVFNTFSYSSVVIVEDDLEVAPDFFEYFRALYPILRSDPTLWCVSAWNDNGREGLVNLGKPELLYRTDFFPGLGWMLLKELWAELEPKWPATFWDDWMRQPDQRKDRACIRPEVSRTLTFGRKGVSLGQFFDQYLRYIKLNTEFVPFTKLDLSYLLRERYNEMFEKEIYSAPLVNVEDLQKGGMLRGAGPFRVQYSSKDSFKVLARNLGVMEDLKSGVPRAGYRGVVSFMSRGRRIYLAPPSGWTNYDTSWS